MLVMFRWTTQISKNWLRIARPSWLARWWQTSTNNQDSHADSHFTVSNSCRRTGVGQKIHGHARNWPFFRREILTLSNQPWDDWDDWALQHFRGAVWIPELGAPDGSTRFLPRQKVWSNGHSVLFWSIPQPFCLGVLGLVDFKNDHLISGSQDLKLVKPRWEFRKTTVNVVYSVSWKISHSSNCRPSTESWKLPNSQDWLNPSFARKL